MELTDRKKLFNEILEKNSEKLRYCEIYKITNLINKKIYIGQAVSHILNHKKFRPYGSLKRFKCHVSEANSSKKNQSHYLNNAIRKYGEENFKVDVLDYCELEDSDNLETKYIKEYNSLFPNGYNLKIGGKTFRHSDESKKRLSDGVQNYYKDKKIQRFSKITHLNDNLEDYIRPLRRDNKQYGWYVRIEKCKADFGGVYISLDQSKQMALNFLEELKEELATYLDAGNPLELQATT